MRRISSAFIFAVNYPPAKYGVLEIGPSGEILSLTDTGGILTETSSLEYYNGILIPGFMIIRLGSENTEKDREAGSRHLWSKGLQAEIWICGKNAEKNKEAETNPKLQQIQSKPAQILHFHVRGDVLKNSPEDPQGKKTNQGIGIESSLTRILQKKPFDSGDMKTELSWHLLTRNTLNWPDKRELFQFFRDNLQRLLYAWEFPDPSELAGFLKFFTKPGEGISLQDALLPLTRNPAKFAGLSHVAGSLEKGTRPGVCLLEGVDFRSMSLLEGAEIRRLV